MAKNYRSCFIVDVKIDTTIRLTDSQRNIYYIDKSDMEMSEFKKWLAKFLKGVSQTLTTFEYVDRATDADFDLHIIKFFNIDDQQVYG